MGSVLYAKEIPETGGDTMFANLYLAYETLSDAMKATRRTPRCEFLPQDAAVRQKSVDENRKTRRTCKQNLFIRSSEFTLTPGARHSMSTGGTPFVSKGLHQRKAPLFSSFFSNTKSARSLHVGFNGRRDQRCVG